MIVHKNINNRLVKTYSDKGFYIIKRGCKGKYKSAVDVRPLKFEYLETNEKIEKEKEE